MQALQRGAFDEARALSEAVLAQSPGHPLAHYILGNAAKAKRQFAAAAVHFEAAVAAKANFAEAIAGLAEIASIENRPDDAARYADQALALKPDLLSARTVAIRSAMHAQDDEAILKHTQAVVTGPKEVSERVATAHYMQARTYERMQRYPESLAAYEAGNAVRADLYHGEFEATDGGVLSLASIQRLQAFLEITDSSTWSKPSDGGPTPAFLVGFPRSGTTLLDQILASHPDIETLEEEPNFADILLDLVHPVDALDKWKTLTSADLDRYRAMYWQRVAEKLGHTPTRAVFIDKMPLNTVLLPLIHLLFPGAKILYALRDPRDVVLSCLTQRFAMNPAMFNFLKLPTTLAYYDAVMTLGESAQRRLPLNTHNIRYEDLVDDFDNSVGELLTFLSLRWDDNVRQHVETAKARQIKTPSAPQVRKPLYSSSIGKWRRYGPDFETRLEPLAPWIRKFGYGS